MWRAEPEQQLCVLSQQAAHPPAVNKNNKIGPWHQNPSIKQYDLETLGPLSYFLQIVLLLGESKILMVLLSQDHSSIFQAILLHDKKLKVLK